jgi:hypothetical protein
MITSPKFNSHPTDKDNRSDHTKKDHTEIKVLFTFDTDRRKIGAIFLFNFCLIYFIVCK